MEGLLSIPIGPGNQPPPALGPGRWQAHAHALFAGRNGGIFVAGHQGVTGQIPLQQQGMQMGDDDIEDEADGEGGDDTGEDDDDEVPHRGPAQAAHALLGLAHDPTGHASGSNVHFGNNVPSTSTGHYGGMQQNGHNGSHVWLPHLQTPAPGGPQFVTPGQLEPFRPTQGEPAWQTWLPPSSPSPTVPAVAGTAGAGSAYFPGWAAGISQAPNTFPPSTSLPNPVTPHNTQAGASHSQHYLNADAFRSLVSPEIARAAQEQDEYERTGRDSAQRSTTARTDADGDHRMRSMSDGIEQLQLANAVANAEDNGTEGNARRAGRSRRDTIKQSNFQTEQQQQQ